ncbi:nucleotidyltransferase domain-containing protein [sulfur-oxidizing endosymbiont of Gigantopelta aegis]|uniref:nucleotidyltransferase domain-containing protein n=1 Tax=sulfur-oxidizing endosymbiont of Gigantopelta aegis TaxID=2794934 RepID=UPI0018DC82CD|nr:nucleotidyltransferase domain-containing protein [sulfur-oxidizing endosymbiont of Gigantopelta aegis]
MRLSTEEINTIKTSLAELDKLAQVYLFGSRVDDYKKGGDIDLLVISKQLAKKDLAKLRWDFYERFGEQKMDIILDDGRFNTPFAKLIYPQALKL